MNDKPPLFAFDNSYARALEGLYVPWRPTPAPEPRLLKLNVELALALGGDPEVLAGAEGLALLAGNRVPAGATPIAQAYAGHQFGHFSPQLGDGRALLLGEVIDRYGKRRDVAFKGSGRTPFSRNGDGKCALGPALREYLIGEAMHALGIPTTRALAVVATGEAVYRERPLPGAVLTRVAASHVRVGTFEFAASRLGPDAVQRLADHVIARHDPELRDHPRPALALLDAVCARQAALVARWLGIGFIHGVMNTDNMTISGETIDYGPCAFLEAYDPATVFSSIDRDGRYAYGRQADIAQWNLARFAETLLPLIHPDEQQAIADASAIIIDFPERFRAQWLAIFRGKLGLDENPALATVDRALAEDFLALLQARHLDFTHSFHALLDTARGEPSALRRLFAADDGEFAEWQQRWTQRQPKRDASLLAAMTRANPWLIPRNHRVEEALDAAVDNEDLGPFNALLHALANPFEVRPEALAYSEAAPPAVTASYRTFCGT